MMHSQDKAKIQRLSIWFAINLVIFVACYLNYRHQLKHRYLYKTLNAGLCLSRAAAMVINFNLLLVWLPMCKYSLTRLAVIACNSANRQRRRLDRHLKSSAGGQDQVLASKFPLTPPMDTGITHRQKELNLAVQHDQNSGEKWGLVSALGRLLHKLIRPVDQVIWRIEYALCTIKIKSINSFLIAVDNCTSLHTICATTITIASVIHTVAHVMNVINFSKNFDPMLGDLNMATYRGQNPLQLLASVPGITGCLMMTILLLMSLSSISIIRNSSFDLFQIFHRLSVLFVVLLILHPSSHILKEQSNVSRHHPDLCFNKLHWQNEQTSAVNGGARDYNNSARQLAGSTSQSPLRPVATTVGGAVHGTAEGAKANSESSAPKSSFAAALPAVSQSQVAGSEFSAAEKRSATVDVVTAVIGNWQDFSHTDSDTIRGSRIQSGDASRRNRSGTLEDSEDERGRVNGTKSGGQVQSEGQIDKSLVNNNDSTIARVKQKREKQQNDTDDQIDQVESSHRPVTGPGLEHRLSALDGTVDSGRTSHSAETSATRTQGTVNWKSEARLAAHHDSGQDANVTATRTTHDELCLDVRPTFVAQSSICWYVLGAGLSCYLLDLILRHMRRSKSSIRLLDACTDGEGNLIELVLSNNHKRFAHWLPGQYVYLNCPQIATYEWHPFTISSMDNHTKQFTLHIKTGGDWTRKLRCELELRKQQQLQQELLQQNRPPLFVGLDCRACCLGGKLHSMSLFFQQAECQKSCACPSHKGSTSISHSNTITSKCTSPQGSLGELCTSTSQSRPDYSKIVNVVANFDCYNHKTGQLQVECKRFAHLASPNSTRAHGQEHQLKKYANDCTELDLDNMYSEGRVYSIHSALNNSHAEKSALTIDHCQSIEPGQRLANLDLFIDGPFHSPFERLLEQQISVCIASGVGWTAFSAVFQQITNESSCHLEDYKQDWWSQWKNFPSSNPRKLKAKGGRSNFVDMSMTPTSGQNLITTTQLVPPTTETISTSTTSNKTKLSLYTGTKLHLMVIVTTIEQLKPFYKIVLKYFKRMQDIAMQTKRDGQTASILSNPIQEVTAFITRSTRCDSDVIDFCRKENLTSYGEEDSVLRINDILTIRFGRPDFDVFLNKFSSLYKDERKISVYCCGSYQVKREIEQICQNINKKTRREHPKRPIYQYHEENF